MSTAAPKLWQKQLSKDLFDFFCNPSAMRLASFLAFYPVCFVATHSCAEEYKSTKRGRKNSFLDFTCLPRIAPLVQVCDARNVQ